MRRLWLVSLATALLTLYSTAAAGAKARHIGWPKIDGLLLINADDKNRPLDGRPGQDIFGSLGIDVVSVTVKWPSRAGAVGGA